jgi:3-oxoacyl-[acyl-carrier protein] reductase
MKKLNDKVAIITGSSAHIGRATALLFAHEGARVVLNARENVQGGETAVDEIRKQGGDAMFIRADLAKPSEADRLFEATLEKFGTVDILINNAGAGHGKAFAESTREDWLAAFDDNLYDAVWCSQRAAKIMLDKQSGVILNTSSIRGVDYAGREGLMAYSAAKSALNSFTKTLAKELAPHVRVNAVAPGFVITSNYDQMSAALKDELINSTLIKRWIQPEEIAEAFLYLAGAEAVTGEILMVDGGFTMKSP